MKNVFFLSLLSILFSCKEKKIDGKYAHIPFLHQVKETKNYEILEINEGNFPLWDSVNRYFMIRGGIYHKYAIHGEFIDSLNRKKITYISDISSFANKDYYTSWLSDGDKTLKRFIDILPEEEPEKIDTIKYKSKHLEFYQKSQYVTYAESGYYYYYYYKKNWYRMHGWGERWIKKHYTEKLPPPRLKSIELNPNPPDYVKQFYVPRKKVNSISDAVGAPKDFSLGTYIIRVGLPGGDSLVYRRFGDGLGNLSTFYQKPSSEGGNDSIIFIKQDYHNNKMIDGGTYFSHGGLFMIRPKRKK